MNGRNETSPGRPPSPVIPPRRATVLSSRRLPPSPPPEPEPQTHVVDDEAGHNTIRASFEPPVSLRSSYIILFVHWEKQFPFLNEQRCVASVPPLNTGILASLEKGEVFWTMVYVGY